MVDHPALLRGLTFDPVSGRARPTEDGPVLVERTDQDFIAALLRELGDADGRRRFAAGVRAGDGLKLFQPVHRTFYVAVLEASCDVFGEPRLDPTKLEGAGLVVRRLSAEGTATGVRDGWMREDGEPRGWSRMVGADELDRDPDPSRRRSPRIGGQPEIDRRLRALDAPDETSAEAVTPLFVAPPAVCAAAGRTILYGLVAVTSSERAVRPAVPTYAPDELRARLSPFFAPELGDAVRLRLSDGATYSAEHLKGDPPTVLAQFVTMLRVMVSVFDAFEDAGMLAALDGVALPLPGGATRPAGQALKQAASALLFGADAAFTMPSEWPRLTRAQAERIEVAAAAASERRLAQLFAREGRFEEPGARYALRAFMRVRRDDGCPPRLVWSREGGPFKIAAWYENGKLPPVPIQLPDITRDNVRKLLPNVAFQVPGGLFDLLSRNKAKDFLDEHAKPGAPGLDWICGFNIPIITICAFIVLTIFLYLLNIVFWWLPFIKICIPIPRSLSAKLKGEFPA